MQPRIGFDFKEGRVSFITGLNYSPVKSKQDFDALYGNGDLYFELSLGIPANQANGQYIYNPTVGHQGISVGYHYYFGNRNND